MRYEVQTLFMDTWENCWTDGDGNPVTYATREEAEQAIAEHLGEVNELVACGDMVGGYEADEFRVVGIAQRTNLALY